MTTYRYTELKQQAKRSLQCRNCSKRFTRTRTFSQTVNPFNKNADGEMKTGREIYAELAVKADAWQPDDLCTACDNDS